jgi:chorismate mutase / prephenate dehydrogenase
MTDHPNWDTAASISELRTRLDEADAELLRLVAQRRELIRPIAAAKWAKGLPLRDYAREREVIMGARTRAACFGLSVQFSDALMELLIADSLSMQEQAQVKANGTGKGKTALIIGGAGKMGRWFADFLRSQAYDVTSADPVFPGDDARQLRHWQSAGLDHDVIVLATPMDRTNDILLELAEQRPRGLIFDICSLKSPLGRGFKSLVDAGCMIVSLHPMFGPETLLLLGKHIVFVDLGVPEALHKAEQLFAGTLAHRMTMQPDEHDRAIGYALGLSHAVNVAFAAVLAGSGPLSEPLRSLSSTTFDQQCKVALGVTAQDAKFYFQIQHLNDYGLEPLQHLQETVQSMYSSVAAGNLEQFAKMMLKGRHCLQQRAQAQQSMSAVGPTTSSASDQDVWIARTSSAPC